MKIALIGGTSLSNTLGKKYMDIGLSVVFGVGTDFDTDSPDWKVINRCFNKICPFESAMIQAEIILFCCPNQEFNEALKALKKVDLRDKILVDCTNNQYHDRLKCSNVNRIMKAAPGVPVFKAFNNLGLDYPLSDSLGVIKEVYFCGEDLPEKIRVKRLIELIGFKAIDAGQLENATLLEAFYHLGKQISGLGVDANYHFKLVSV